MIFSRNYVPMDESRQELMQQNLSLFDFQVNDGDIHQYLTGYIPSHWHPQLELFVLLKGRVHVGIGDQSYILNAGEGCFINSGVLHSFTAAVPDSCAYHSFVFDAGIVSGMPGSIFDVRYVRPLLESGMAFYKFDQTAENERYFTQFNVAFNACVQENTGFEFCVRDCISDILLFLKEKLAFTASSRPAINPQEQHLKTILRWIDTHLQSTVTLDDLAACAAISPRECQRIFKRYLHCRPMEYLRRRRILTCADILQNSDMPITQIAFEYGFPSSAYFSRQFKLLAGCTPTEYRKRLTLQ